MESEIYSTTNGKVYTKAGSDKPLSVLTYPMSDIGGDYVRPDGGDWSSFPAHPLVNWTHKCPIGRGEVFVKALKNGSETCPVAIGRTTFAEVAADLEGLDLRKRDPRTQRFWDKEAPYTTDECLETAEQARMLLDKGLAEGVSIEFNIDPTKKGVEWWDILNTDGTPKKSVLDQHRNARHFDKWKGLAYAHARQPVNPGCTTLDKDVPDALYKAIVIAETGKLDGMVLNPIILKAFDDVRALRQDTRRASVTVPNIETKSMDRFDHTDKADKHSRLAEHHSNQAEAHGSARHHEQAADHHENAHFAHMEAANEHHAAGDKRQAKQHEEAAAKHSDSMKYHRSKTVTKAMPEEPSTPEKTDGGDCPSHGCKALFNLAQGIMDLIQNFGTDIKMSDDRNLRKYGRKLVAKLTDVSGDIKARGEKHKGKMDDENDDGSDDAFDDDEEMSTEEKAIVVDSEGAIILKAFPEWKPRRYKLSDVLSHTTPKNVQAPASTQEDTVVVKAKDKRLRELLAQIAQETATLTALSDAAAVNK